MFKNLFDIWKGKAFIDKVHDDFASMLELAEKMYKEAQWFIFVDDTREDMHSEIYAMDRDINQLERNIRTRVLEHLALQPAADVSASLIMINVTKDAERLGDYIKNVSEVRGLLKGPVNQEIYREFLGEIDEQISEMFISSKKAFLNSDEELAAQIGNQKKILAKQCEEVIQNIANSKMKAREAVVYALLARYYKRLVSHLGNIATTVILPFSDVGYYSFKNIAKADTVMVLCSENKSRSQLFEAIFRSLAGDKLKVISAGATATSVHPLVIKVLAEINISDKRLISKKLGVMNIEKDALALIDENGKKLEYRLSELSSVITLCDSANESCPVFPGKVRREHWPIDDPGKNQGTDEELLAYFRIARDDIFARIQEFLARG
ncbi:MAG: PhoU domain-containing protein [Candidatus Margulisbacteria bacterium]|nr:PhoU domain-containing protein [Candidatus Margulisiibacteriota bacterium]